LTEHFPLRGKEYPIERAETHEKSHGRIEIRKLEVDVTFNEDRCRVRNRNKGQVLAVFRNLAITLLHLLGYENIAEGIEILAENKQAALRFVRLGRIE
jgi:hypothetical protein